jgi:hypothetical protein
MSATRESITQTGYSVEDAAALTLTLTIPPNAELRQRIHELHVDEGWSVREAKQLAVAEMGGGR